MYMYICRKKQMEHSVVCCLVVCFSMATPLIGIVKLRLIRTVNHR